LNNLYSNNALNKTKEILFSDLKKWMNEQGDKGIQTEMEALTRFKGDTLKWKSSSD